MVPSLHEVVIDNFVFFFAPVDLIFLTALLDTEYVAEPNADMVGDARVTVFFLNVTVTLHVAVGDDVMTICVPVFTEIAPPFAAAVFT